jgi:hypothetical protein
MIDPMPTVAPPFLILVTPYLQNVDTVVIIFGKISHIIVVNKPCCILVSKIRGILSFWARMPAPN